MRRRLVLKGFKNKKEGRKEWSCKIDRDGTNFYRAVFYPFETLSFEVLMSVEVAVPVAAVRRPVIQKVLSQTWTCVRFTNTGWQKTKMKVQMQRLNSFLQDLGGPKYFFQKN